MALREPEGEVIIYYTLEPELEQPPLPTCQYCSKQFKTEAKRKYHISKYHVLIRYRTGNH
jgi:PHP family Zn ribbon phosphoesterase